MNPTIHAMAHKTFDILYVTHYIIRGPYLQGCLIRLYTWLYAAPRSGVTPIKSHNAQKAAHTFREMVHRREPFAERIEKLCHGR